MKMQVEEITLNCGCSEKIEMEAENGGFGFNLW